MFLGNRPVLVFLVIVEGGSQVETSLRKIGLPFVIMMGESIGGEQCSNLAHLPFSKKSGGEKGRVCGYAMRGAQYTTCFSAVFNM